MVQKKFQLDIKDIEFIKTACKTLHYKSLSDYIRKAVIKQINTDRKRIRQAKREKAMKAYGIAKTVNIFESIESDDFEDR